MPRNGGCALGAVWGRALATRWPGHLGLLRGAQPADFGEEFPVAGLGGVELI